MRGTQRNAASIDPKRENTSRGKEGHQTEKLETEKCRNGRTNGLCTAEVESCREEAGHNRRGRTEEQAEKCGGRKISNAENMKGMQRNAEPSECRNAKIHRGGKKDIRQKN